MSILVLIANVLRLLYMILGIWLNRKEIKVWFLDQSSPLLERDSAVGRYVLDWRIVIIMQMIALGVFVTMIELFLAWNGVAGVNYTGSAGQLIPLVTGVAGFISICLP